MSSQYHHVIGTIGIPIFHVRKLRLRRVKSCVLGEEFGILDWQTQSL